VLDRVESRLIPGLMPASIPALLAAPTPNGRTGILSRHEVPWLADMGVRVSVIPTLNEEENLPHVFAGLPPGLHEVIVVDCHSTSIWGRSGERAHPPRSAPSC
jgi:hypothetical protein